MENTIVSSNLDIGDVVKSASAHVKDSFKLLSNESVGAVNEPRCFYLIDGKVIFSILLLETYDSFLVGANARIIMGEDKNIRVEQVTSSPTLRILKSSVAFVALPEKKSLYEYFKYLAAFGEKILPDLFSTEMKESVNNYITDFEFTNNNDIPKSSVKKSPGESSLSFRPHSISIGIH